MVSRVSCLPAVIRRLGIGYRGQVTSLRDKHILALTVLWMVSEQVEHNVRQGPWLFGWSK